MSFFSELFGENRNAFFGVSYEGNCSHFGRHYRNSHAYDRERSASIIADAVALPTASQYQSSLYLTKIAKRTMNAI